MENSTLKGKDSLFKTKLSLSNKKALNTKIFSWKKEKKAFEDPDWREQAQSVPSTSKINPQFKTFSFKRRNRMKISSEKNKHKKHALNPED